MSKVVYLEKQSGGWEEYLYLDEYEYENVPVLIVEDITVFGVKRGGAGKCIRKNKYEYCIFIDKNNFKLDEIVQELIVLHELGHLKKYHSGESRMVEQEIEADRFAANRAVEIHGLKNTTRAFKEMLNLINPKSNKAKDELAQRTDAILELLE